MSRSNEAFWWSLFSAGGVMSALFIPVFIVLSSFLIPFAGSQSDETRYDHLVHAVSFWPVRLVLLVVLALCFFHCAHRIRHVVTTVGLRISDGLLAVVCYGAALAGAIATVFVLARL